MHGWGVFQVSVLTVFALLLAGRTLQLRLRDGTRAFTLFRGSKSRHEVALEIAFVVGVLLWVGEVVSLATGGELRLLGTASATVLLSAGWAKLVGAVVALLGVFIFAAALRAFGTSWRVGIDHQAPGALVTGGVFALSRNPIFLAMDLLLLGTFLIWGTATLLALAAAFAAGFHLQIRQEEAFLAGRYGHAYDAYRARVRRYV